MADASAFNGFVTYHWEHFFLKSVSFPKTLPPCNVRVHRRNEHVYHNIGRTWHTVPTLYEIILKMSDGLTQWISLLRLNFKYSKTLTKRVSNFLPCIKNYQKLKCSCLLSRKESRCKEGILINRFKRKQGSIQGGKNCLVGYTRMPCCTWVAATLWEWQERCNRGVVILLNYLFFSKASRYVQIFQFYIPLHVSIYLFT